jgi:hypothetical protein
MSSPTEGQQHAFNQPGKYCIRVLGFLDESWSDRIGGLRISSENLEDLGVVTTLTGTISDQQDLADVLENLYELHLTLLSIEMLQNGK